MQTILLAVASDPLPLAAARRAAWLAQRLEARIVLLHVARPDEDETEWQRLCESLLPIFEDAEVTPLLRQGRPLTQIMNAAREEDADLIVMTRHARWLGEGGRMFHRFLLNSVLMRTIEESGCPVWVEPEGQGPPLRRLLCGITSLFRDRD